MPRALRSFLSIFFGLFLLGAGGFFTASSLWSPQQAPWYVFLAVYFSIFLAVFGATGCLHTILRYIFSSAIEILKNRRTITRQSFFLGVLAVTALIFQSYRLLNTYSAILLILTIAILEMYFLSSEQSE